MGKEQLFICQSTVDDDSISGHSRSHVQHVLHLLKDSMLGTVFGDLEWCKAVKSEQNVSFRNANTLLKYVYGAFKPGEVTDLMSLTLTCPLVAIASLKRNLSFATMLRFKLKVINKR